MIRRPEYRPFEHLFRSGNPLGRVDYPVGLLYNNVNNNHTGANDTDSDDRNNHGIDSDDTNSDETESDDTDSDGGQQAMQRERMSQVSTLYQHAHPPPHPLPITIRLPQPSSASPTLSAFFSSHLTPLMPSHSWYHSSSTGSICPICPD